MQFKVLGPLELRRGAALLDVGTPKARAVLAVLLCRPGRPVAVNTLIGELWSESAPPKTATKNIQLYIHQLRRLLGPDRIVRDERGYRIVVNSDELDADRFAVHVRAARASEDPAEVARLLREALGLWRGTEAFFGTPDTSMVRIERQRLAELRLSALERRIDACLLSDPAAPVADLVALTGENPLRERFWAQLMTALWAGGRQADALEAFERARQALKKEGDIRPGPELSALQRDILAGRSAPDLERAGTRDAAGHPASVCQPG
jgi:DNA-binding SARP family transcriptional activator